MTVQTKDVRRENGLKPALEAFETAVATPIISGELASWVTGLRKTWEKASFQLRESLCCTHKAQYDEMAEHDLEMLPRIDQLKAEDDSLSRECEEINQAVGRTVQHVPKLEPDEAKAQKHVEELVDRALAFITRVRKHEVAVETWFVEAFNRDRGAVD